MDEHPVTERTINQDYSDFHPAYAFVLLSHVDDHLHGTVTPPHWLVQSVPAPPRQLIMERIQCLLNQHWRSDEYRHSVFAHSFNTSWSDTCFPAKI